MAWELLLGTLIRKVISCMLQQITKLVRSQRFIAQIMEYIADEKIPENINQWNCTESDYRNFKKTDWVLTEKIHGANFGIVTDGLEVRFAKRKQYLDSS